MAAHWNRSHPPTRTYNFNARCHAYAHRTPIVSFVPYTPIHCTASAASTPRHTCACDALCTYLVARFGGLALRFRRALRRSCLSLPLKLPPHPTHAPLGLRGWFRSGVSGVGHAHHHVRKVQETPQHACVHVSVRAHLSSALCDGHRLRIRFLIISRCRGVGLHRFLCTCGLKRRHVRDRCVCVCAVLDGLTENFVQKKLI